MKLATLILLCGLCSVWADDFRLQIVRHNKSVTPQNANLLVTNALQCVQWAGSDATDSFEPNEREQIWKEILNSDSFVHVTFTPPRNITFVGKNASLKNRPVNEILIALPECTNCNPRVQVKSGTNYILLGHFDTFAIKHLVTEEPALGLSTVPNYDFFFQLKEPNK